MKKPTLLLTVVSLLYVASFASASVTMDLTAGPNVIGVPSEELVKKCNVGNFERFKDKLPNRFVHFDSSLGWRVVNAMFPGKGYFVYLNKDCRFTFTDLLDPSQIEDNRQLLSVSKIVLYPGINLVSSPAALTQQDLEDRCEGNGKIVPFSVSTENAKLITWKGRTKHPSNGMEPYKGYFVKYEGSKCEIPFTSFITLPETKERSSPVPAPQYDPNTAKAGCSWGWSSKDSPLKFEELETKVTGTSSDTMTIEIKGKDGTTTETVKKTENYFSQVTGIGRYDTGGRHIYIDPFSIQLDKPGGSGISGSLAIGEDFYGCWAARREGANKAEGSATTLEFTIDKDKIGKGEKLRVTGKASKALLDPWLTGGAVLLRVYDGIVTPTTTSSGFLVGVGQVTPSSDGSWSWDFGMGSSYFRAGAFTIVATVAGNGISVNAYRYFEGVE